MAWPFVQVPPHWLKAQDGLTGTQFKVGFYPERYTSDQTVLRTTNPSKNGKRKPYPQKGASFGLTDHVGFQLLSAGRLAVSGYDLEEGTERVHRQ